MDRTLVEVTILVGGRVSSRIWRMNQPVKIEGADVSMVMIKIWNRSEQAATPLLYTLYI